MEAVLYPITKRRIVNVWAVYSKGMP